MENQVQTNNTELATTQANQTALAAQEAPTINLPILVNKEEIMEASQANRADNETFRLDKVKMPSSGGITFERIDESGKPFAVSGIKGVILKFENYKSWYEKSFNEKGADDSVLPDCFSADGTSGTGCPDKGIQGGPCANCPMNQWGSDRRGGRGKDCSDRTRIWILEEGCAIPFYMDLPKTSIGGFKDYRKRLTQKAKVLYGVVTSITLEKGLSETKIENSKANFGKVADLTTNERASIREYIKEIDSMLTVSRETIDAHSDDVTDSFTQVADNIQNGNDQQPY
jgi:hypothetical protein